MWLAAFSSSSVMPYVRPGGADARRRVDQRHLAEPAGAAVARRVAREVGAVVVVVGADLDQPAGGEPAVDAVDAAPVQRQRPGAAEGARRAPRIGAREHLLRRHVGAEAVAVDGRLVGRAPLAAARHADLQLGAGRPQHDAVEAQLVQPDGARRQHLDVPVPGIRRVGICHTAERGKVGCHLPRGGGRIQLGVHRGAPALDRIGDDAEPQRVALHLAQVDALAGDARGALARGARRDRRRS